MISTLNIKNFKSLRDVRLELGQLNFFIGTNASGKSNVFDAIRVLQGIGNGFTVGEILDGKPKSATSEQWDSIRGGSFNATFRRGKSEPISLGVDSRRVVTIAQRRYTRYEHFEISLDPSHQKISHESFRAGSDEIYTSGSIHNSIRSPSFKVRYNRGSQGKPPHIDCESGRAVITQLSKGGGKWTKAHAERAAQFSRFLANVQRLDPSPAVLREYSQAANVSRMGERGENFSALIRTICKDSATKAAYLTWLKHLRPSEVDDVGVLEGAVGDTMFKLEEGGQEFPAPVLSDGTLRFAAIAAAFFQPDMPALLTLEEIENGIHASRLRLLVELLRNRAQEGKTQVIVTTHSPIVLAWLQPEEYKHTFFCKRDEETGESKILPLTEIPHFSEIVKKQPIGDLFAEGWMEAAL
jgi:predicted ATPase